MPAKPHRFDYGVLGEIEFRDVGVAGLHRLPGRFALNAALRARGMASGRLATGGQFTLDGMGFDVLWPDADRVPGRLERGSQRARRDSRGGSEAVKRIRL